MNLIRRHRWWLLPELTALVVLGGMLIYANADRLNDEMSERAQVVLEQQTPVQLELISTLHGHDIPEPERVLCVAEAFGSDPADADTIEQVRVIYAQYLCALVQKGTPWDYATRSSGPAVITLTNPPTVQLAKSGQGYRERVRAIFPDQLESKALAGFNDHGRPNSLLVRYRVAVS